MLLRGMPTEPHDYFKKDLDATVEHVKALDEEHTKAQGAQAVMRECLHDIVEQMAEEFPDHKQQLADLLEGERVKLASKILTEQRSRRPTSK